MADISALSSEELIVELKKHGLKVGPITPTTRKLFEKKLARARGQEIQKIECDEICAISSIKEQKSDVVDGSTSTNENIVNIPSNNSNSFHYGVSFNRSNNDGSFNTEPAVFNSQQQALQAVKQLKNKGARFKPFKTREEAERFSLSSLTCTPNSPVAVQKSVDPVGNLKKPTPQELIKFRKIIESGNHQDFLSIVHANPKYLISSGDTPVILQEGFRYNAMHIAAKENKPGMCKLIVDTVESDQFWNRYLSLNNDDKLSPMNFKRKQFLADLYLNTPDKGNFETPLHFGCKFGHVEVIKYLVSHPLTNTSPRNKYNETPEQIICSRCSSQSGSVRLIEAIKHILEDTHYVPVFGSEGDASPPSIGEPWSPDIHRRSSSQSPVRSPVDPRMTVRAYAGPMSPSKAAEFHHLWKTPPGSVEEKKKFIDIRRGDSTRGLERLGRKLAHAQNIPWAEYWDFLGAYIDLAQPSGLERLEEYFRERLSKLENEHFNQGILRTPVMPNRFPSHQNSDRFSTPERTMSGSSSVLMDCTGSDYIGVQGSPLLNPVYSKNDSFALSNSIETTCKELGQLSLDHDNVVTSVCNLQKTLIVDKQDCHGKQNSIDKHDTDAHTLSPTHENFNSKYEDKESELFLCKTNLLDQLRGLNIEDDEEGNLGTVVKDEDNDHQQKHDQQHKQELLSYGEALNQDHRQQHQNHQQQDRQQEHHQQHQQQHNLQYEQQQKHLLKQDGQQQQQQHDRQQHDHQDTQQQQQDQLQQQLQEQEQQWEESQMQQQHQENKQQQPQSKEQREKQQEQPQPQPQQQHHQQQHHQQQQHHHQQQQQQQQQKQQIKMLPDQQENVFISMESMRRISNKRTSTDDTDSVTNKRETMALFINGCYPSKTDLDVLRALEGASVSFENYPLVAQWRERVMSYTATTRESWPSPGSPLCRSRSKQRFTTTS